MRIDEVFTNESTVRTRINSVHNTKNKLATEIQLPSKWVYDIILIKCPLILLLFLFVCDVCLIENEKKTKKNLEKENLHWDIIIPFAFPCPFLSADLCSIRLSMPWPLCMGVLTWHYHSFFIRFARILIWNRWDVCFFAFHYSIDLVFR